jgi:hypothetical protein
MCGRATYKLTWKEIVTLPSVPQQILKDIPRPPIRPAGMIEPALARFAFVSEPSQSGIAQANRIALALVGRRDNSRRDGARPPSCAC